MNGRGSLPLAHNAQHSTSIPANPMYGVYISQLGLVRISRICDIFDTFCARHKLLTRRLIAQGFLYDKLCAYFKLKDM